MLLNFQIIRLMKRPLRAPVFALAFDLLITAMLGVALVLLVYIEGPWVRDYSGGLLGLSRVLLAVAAFGVLGACTHPWLMLRAVRRVSDDQHEVDSLLASFATMALLTAVLLPAVGFIGAMAFKDPWFFIGLSLLQVVPIAVCWLTPRRRQEQEQLLRARGVLVPECV